MSLSKTDTDIILNKANIALARSQRLVASWLPAQPAATENGKSEKELQKEEDEIFTAVPETLGLGAPLPLKAADGSWHRTELDSNDQLWRQLLGRNYKKVMAEKARQKGAEAGPPAKNSMSKGPGQQQRSPGGNDKAEDDEDDEDEGRTASIGKKNMPKKRKVEAHSESPTQAEGEVQKDDSDEEEGKAASSRPQPKARGRKKATSYLDELLAERSKKRQKR